MQSNDPIAVVLFVLLIIPAIILHEVSHGYVAYLLGDPTAKDAGRLTLNPLAHVDLWGTIILPALMIFTLGFAIGYAKPVPIDPRRMTRVGMRNGMLITGAAGPLTNIALAIVAGLLTRLFVGLLGPQSIVVDMAWFFTFINLVLAFFNLIPIPPLDGSRVLQRFLSGRALQLYSQLEQWGFFIVLALVFLLPRLTGIDILGGYLQYTVYPLARFFTGI